MRDGGRWLRHSAALAPLHDTRTESTRHGLLDAFAGDVSSAVDFLQLHGLAGWWAVQQGIEPTVHAEAPGEWAGRLSAARRQSVAHQLLQESAMQALQRALCNAGIEFVWLKTAGIRRTLYKLPGQRPSADLDLLVRPPQRDAASRVIEQFGAQAWAGPTRSHHERTFHKGSVDIDLHWDLLAPGRLRGSIVDDLLRRRVQTPLGFRNDDNDVLFVSLTHLAFAKYVCSPHAGLNRVLDVVTATQQLEIDTAELALRLHEAGAAAAAWAVLDWLRILLPDLSPRLLLLADLVAPGVARQRYVHSWLANAWPNRLAGSGDLITQIGLTLPLHDTFGDALRAIRGRLWGGVPLPR